MDLAQELILHRLRSALHGQGSRGVEREALQHLDEVDQPLHRLAVEVRRPVHQRVLVVERECLVAAPGDGGVAQDVRQRDAQPAVVLLHDGLQTRRVFLSLHLHPLFFILAPLFLALRIPFPLNWSSRGRRRNSGIRACQMLDVQAVEVEEAGHALVDELERLGAVAVLLVLGLDALFLGAEGLDAVLGLLLGARRLVYPALLPLPRVARLLPNPVSK